MCNMGLRGHFWSDRGQFLFSTNMWMWVGTQQKIVFRSDIATTVCGRETEEKQSRQPVEINLTNNKQQHCAFLLLSLTFSSHTPKPKVRPCLLVQERTAEPCLGSAFPLKCQWVPASSHVPGGATKRNCLGSASLFFKELVSLEGGRFWL